MQRNQLAVALLALVALVAAVLLVVRWLGRDDRRAPASVPSRVPAPNQAPSQAPSRAPTPVPSRAPTRAPTHAPTRAPTQAPARAPPTPAVSDECLCIYDNDRTLTAAQRTDEGECPGTKTVPGVDDPAYGGGTYRQSAALLQLPETPCAACLSAVISAGVPYEPEKELIRQALPRSPPADALLWGVPDGTKQDRVPTLLDLYESELKVRIAPERVFFFDDRSDNVAPFRVTGYNAHQVSCASRDQSQGGAVGLCGAVGGEVALRAGVSLC